ncbi:MAG: AMP-binding protein [Hyphomicrobiales bacterium]|nr:AMP-binding protein [Hyphomicrobiales bacterium]
MITANIANYITMNAARRPEKVALIQGDRSVTYASLDRDVSALCMTYQDAGLGRGDIVGIAMRDSIDYVAMMLAAFRLGIVLLPMDSRWTPVEKANVARFFEARAVVLDTGTETVVGNSPVLRFDPAMYRRDTAGLRLPDGFSADEPLVLSLSSGTTGIPKGPMISHRHYMLRHYTEWLALGFLQTDINLCSTPLYFGGGRYFTLSYLLAGATVVINSPPYELAELASVISRFGVTTTFLVPTLLRRLATEPDDVRAPFQKLRFIVCSGSSLHPTESAELSAKVNSCIINHYASTEGGSVSMHNPMVEGPANGSVGRSVLGSTLEIADADDNALPQGETGLIRHRAPWHPAGFHNSPEETKKAFRKGWYYPGDIGHIDPNGYLFITGRAKDMIIRGGINIYPDEIEATLLTMPQVEDAAVVGRPSAELGEEVVAFVTVKSAVDPEMLRAHCRSVLSAYKVPAEIIFLDALPRNQSGKIVKAKLRESFEARA